MQPAKAVTKHLQALLQKKKNKEKNIVVCSILTGKLFSERCLIVFVMNKPVHGGHDRGNKKKCTQKLSTQTLARHPAQPSAWVIQNEVYAHLHWQCIRDSHSNLATNGHYIAVVHFLRITVAFHFLFQLSIHQKLLNNWIFTDLSFNGTWS